MKSYTVRDKQGNPIICGKVDDSYPLESYPLEEGCTIEEGDADIAPPDYAPSKADQQRSIMRPNDSEIMALFGIVKMLWDQLDPKAKSKNESLYRLVESAEKRFTLAKTIFPDPVLPVIEASVKCALLKPRFKAQAYRDVTATLRVTMPFKFYATAFPSTVASVASLMPQPVVRIQANLLTNAQLRLTQRLPKVNLSLEVEQPIPTQID